MDGWKETIREERRQKDEFFAEHPHSPIASHDQEGFDGLRYFELDSSYRYTLELDVEDDPETITVETTQDGTQTYHRWGSFTFTVDGVECTLWAFKSGDNEGLWVPFRDETNGEQTYDAGRYLDLDPEENLDGATWTLDFNRAYSPFCAYSDAYECPLVPMDNWLDISIEVGEKYPV